MSTPVGIALLAAAALGVLAILYRAFKSPLRPLLIPFEAWRVALAGPRAKPRTFLLALLMIASGAGLQELFTYGLRFDNTILTIASVAWQAITAIVMAMIAVPFHLHIIGREPKGFVIDGRIVEPATLRSLLPWAAALGGAIWLITYLVELLGKLAIFFWVPPTKAILAYRLVQLAGFVAAALLALVRPALSSGLRPATGSGVRIAMAHFPSLLAVDGLLLVPPMMFKGLTLVILAYVGRSIGAHVLNDVSIVIFSVFQFLAFEAATVIFLRTAILTPGPTAYQVAYAHARPY